MNEAHWYQNSFGLLLACFQYWFNCRAPIWVIVYPYAKHIVIKFNIREFVKGASATIWNRELWVWKFVTVSLMEIMKIKEGTAHIIEWGWCVIVEWKANS